MADEVICGFGRTGHWFGSDRFGIRADLMAIAKGMSSGYLPIGGVMVADRVAEVLISRGGEVAHGYTYSGHPVACAVASANLRIIERENLVARVRDELALSCGEVAPARRASLVGEPRAAPVSSAPSSWWWDKTSRRFFDKRGEVGTICRDFGSRTVSRARCATR